MDWSYLPRGIVIGLSVAAPIGPMAILCIRRTLAFGRAAGLVSGIGVAAADAFYGGVAAFGLTSVSSLLVEIQAIVRIVGGLFLCYLGWNILRSSAGAIAVEDAGAKPGYGGAFFSTLGLTLTNPATILSFAAIFSGFGFAAEKQDPASATTLVIGVFAGSTLWWVILTTGTGMLRAWLTSARLTIINRVFGFALLTFGALAILSVIR